MMGKIFSFRSAIEYLSHVWDEKKKINPSFSLRAWSKQLGFESNAQLSLVLAGKRSIPRKYIPKFVSNLHLDKQESEYFELLIDLERTKNPELKKYYKERVERFATTQLQDVSENPNLLYMRNPFYTTLLEMVELKGYKMTNAWLMEHLSWALTEPEVKKIYSQLAELGLIKVEGDQSVQKTFRHLISPHDVASVEAVRYHSHTCELALQALRDLPVEQRDFTSLSFNVESSRLPEAKEALQTMIETFIKRFEAKTGEGDETYQLSVQLFPMTRHK